MPGSRNCALPVLPCPGHSGLQRLVPYSAELTLIRFWKQQRNALLPARRTKRAPACPLTRRRRSSKVICLGLRTKHLHEPLLGSLADSKQRLGVGAETRCRDSEQAISRPALAAGGPVTRGAESPLRDRAPACRAPPRRGTGADTSGAACRRRRNGHGVEAENRRRDAQATA